MYLAKLQTRGFRCLDNFSIEFGPGLNVIVGPNNAGKTAIVEAISLVLSTWGNPAREIYARPEDFWHSADGKDRAEREFKISLDLLGVPDESIGLFRDWIVNGEQGRLACISVIGRRSSSDVEKVKLTHGVGERDNAQLTEEAIDRLRPVFLPPLRDAENHLRPGRRSRLARLVQHITDEAISAEIESKFEKLQGEIIKKPPFSTAIERVNDRLANASGAFYKQIAHLGFVELEFKRITELLQMRIGLEGMLDYALTENGLGYNNLLYIATILSQLSKDSDQDLRLLLIEEPEAHLHPQMQQVLVDALMDASAEAQAEGEKRSQIIMTSHSPILAAHVPIDNIIVLHQHRVEPPRPATDTSRPKKEKPLARNISQFNLESKTVADLSRYLDSTKANLFFADGIILVEGIAEALLLPLFAKAINRPLNERHVSVVNVDGLAFGPFIDLFNSLDRLQIPCALVTDSDPRFREGDRFYSTKKQPPVANYDKDSDDEVEGDDILFPKNLPSYGRAYKLEESSQKAPSGARVFRNLKTFEYDLALTEYLDHMIAAYKDVDAAKGTEIEEAITSENDRRRKAIRFFKQFSPKDKAHFAQHLASRLDLLIKNHWMEQESSKGKDRANWDIFLEPPNYISGAIKWVTGGCNWDEIK